MLEEMSTAIMEGGEGDIHRLTMMVKYLVICRIIRRSTEQWVIATVHSAYPSTG